MIKRNNHLTNETKERATTFASPPPKGHALPANIKSGMRIVLRDAYFRLNAVFFAAGKAVLHKGTRPN